MGAHAARPAPLERLNSRHDVEAFDCGVPELDLYLRKYALQAMSQGSAKTLVLADGPNVMGYITSAYGVVTAEGATLRMMKGMARHPQPILLLARLAIDRRYRGQGLGRILFLFFVNQALEIDDLARDPQHPEIPPLRGIAVHAKDDEAARLYRHMGLEPSPIDGRHLMALLKDIRKTLA